MEFVLQTDKDATVMSVLIVKGKKKTDIPEGGFQRCDHLDMVFWVLALHSLVLGLPTFRTNTLLSFKASLLHV
jgi:hypothetical protein